MSGRNYRAVRAVQIMNAPCWASYLQRMGGLGGGSRNAQLADRYLSHEAVYIVAPWYATLAGATMSFNNASQSRLDRRQESAAVGQVWHSTCAVYLSIATKNNQKNNADLACQNWMLKLYEVVLIQCHHLVFIVINPFAPSPLLQGTKWSWILARHLEWWAHDAADLGGPNGGGHESWSRAAWFGSPIGLALESVYQLTGYSKTSQKTGVALVPIFQKSWQMFLSPTKMLTYPSRYRPKNQHGTQKRKFGRCFVFPKGWFQVPYSFSEVYLLYRHASYSFCLWTKFCQVSAFTPLKREVNASFPKIIWKRSFCSRGGLQEALERVASQGSSAG